MSYIEVRGTQKLNGEICIQGSKNAVLPVMAASLLHKGITVIRQIPLIQDVRCMMEILQSLGCRLELNGHQLVLDTRNLNGCRIPDKESGQMRSSVLLLAPLLARTGEVCLYQPGGCRIGARPVDLHLMGLGRMGAEFLDLDQRIEGKASRLKGRDILLAYPSVGATENLIMAAAAAEGISCIRGAAREPEIVVLCEFLTMLGAKIQGAGEDIIRIEGRSLEKDAEITMPGDRIVAGTYMGAVLAAGGEVYLRNADFRQLQAVCMQSEKMGAKIQRDQTGIVVQRAGELAPVQISTGPYPQFPTDLQSVFLSAAVLARGNSEITENVFEARFAIVKELQKMGAHIIIRGRQLLIEGVRGLQGARLQAEDLRGGAALAAAALAAQGRSEIRGCEYIFRGYEDLCGDLRCAGADVTLKGQE